MDSTLKNKVMPSKLDFYISGEFARIDQHTKIGVQTTIIDTLLNKHILLIQLMDKKFGIIINDHEWRYLLLEEVNPAYMRVIYYSG